MSLKLVSTHVMHWPSQFFFLFHACCFVFARTLFNCNSCWTMPFSWQHKYCIFQKLERIINFSQSLFWTQLQLSIMNHTTRTLSALTIWTVSMAIFFLSNPTRVRAFSMTTPNTLSTSRTITGLNYFQHQVIASTDFLEDTSSYESKRVLQRRQRKWIEQSTHYYTTIMKNEKRRT